MKKLTKVQEKVLSTFKKFKECPSNDTLAKKLKLSGEYTRTIMWQLVALKALKVNKKLKSKKFYV